MSNVKPMGTSYEWIQFVKEFEETFRRQTYTTVKSFEVEEANVHCDGSITDRFKVHLTNGETVYIYFDLD